MTGVLRNVLLDFLVVAANVAPVIAVVVFFQFAALRSRLPNPKAIVAGFIAVIAGLYCFLAGLDIGVFPIGFSMAEKFSRQEMGLWPVIFAFCLGYSATIAEPALLAVALKAEEITTGGIRGAYLRNVVAAGVACGLALGVWRIIAGGELWLYITIAYAAVITLTLFAPREIIPLAYDSGGVTTSTITVPFVTALGLGMASDIPGRVPLRDGFGLVAFAVLFPIISTLSYAIAAKYINERNKRR